MSEKQKQLEVYNVIYDISQGIIATGFRSGETCNCNWGIVLLKDEELARDLMYIKQKLL